jgi:sialate O-acetylesterase
MRTFLSSCSLVVSLLILASSVPEIRADVTLPKVIGDHMVLERDRPLPIWGWADPGEEVTVKLDGAAAAAKADARGGWKVVLPPVSADGKTHRLTVRGKNKIELDDILIGDVWLGSGQSNMDFPLGGSRNGKEAIAAANYPQIRLLHVAKIQRPQPAADIVIWSAKNDRNPQAKADESAAAWQACSPKTAATFSAPLYFFGERLHKDLDVPIGLIDDSWGGSGIEPWTIFAGKSGGMYNAMIAPVKPLAIAGVIWYQGETNAFQNNGMQYYEKMQHLIGGWREVWGNEFPFYFVQIAPFVGFGKIRYPDGALMAIWEAQAASLKIPGTGMVVVTDKVHDLKNIHPIDKREVGERLALWALAKVYGKRGLVYSGPLYKSMQVAGGKIRLAFAHVGGGLKSRDGKPLSEFEIAGADGKFAAAEAAIDGATVLVGAKEVTSPTQARFAWRIDANPNLINQEGLPAAPFRTENWQGGTGE